MRSLTLRILGAAVSVTLIATAAHAQTIAGVVKDVTGAIMPGVTVEASSPALIEKVRSAVTNGEGQFKIVSLSPGVYTVTFTLPGFSTVKRDGIALSTDFTAGVNAEMRVGSVEELVTVTAASPLVDMQTVTKQTVLTREVLDQLPAARSIQGAGVTIPGVTMSATVGGGRDVGGSTKLQQPGLTFHGNTGTIQRWDGFWLSNVQGTGTGGATSFYVNDSGTQELVYSTGAETMDMSAPGLYVNMIPKDGGNRFTATGYADFTHEGWQANNFSADLAATGLSGVARVFHISDFNVGIGGPLIKDRLWYFAAYRYEAISQTVVDSYYNASPNPYKYVPDLSRPGVDDGKIPNQSGRVTWQVSQRDKIQGWFTNQNKYRSHYNISASRTPDATSLQNTPYAQAMTVKWARTQNDRLLFEGGAAVGRTLYQELYHPDVCSGSDLASVQACTTYSITDIANGKIFNAYDNGYSGHGGTMENGRFSAEYVNGSHDIKAGVMIGHAVSPAPNWYSGDITMNFNNGAPASIVERIPVSLFNGYYPDLGLYAQDRWTFKRATVTAGLRYDYYVENVLPGTLPGSRWNPEQSFPTEVAMTHWKDFSPRVGIAYDLFGNGKTALKWSIARYVASDGLQTAINNNPQTTIGRTNTVTWNDLNGDFTIYNANGSLQSNELGPTTNVNFGKIIPSTTTQDPATLTGFNARPSTVEWQGVVQQQLTPALALNGGYYFRWNGNQTVTNNTLQGTIGGSGAGGSGAYYDGPFCVTAPVSPQLPNGGGYPICGLYDIKPGALGKVQNNVTFARNFGGVVDHFMGYDLGLTVHLAGTNARAGVSSQKRVFNTCNAPILSGTTVNQVNNPEAVFCNQVTPYRPDFKLAGSQNLPGDFTIAGTYQVSSGPMITATWAAPNSVIAPALGRNSAAGATATKSIQLIEPGTLYGSYQNQLDLRLSRRFKFGKIRVRADANLYNAFNNAYANSVNTVFSTSASNQFLRPTAVLLGRLFKIGGQFDF